VFGDKLKKQIGRKAKLAGVVEVDTDIRNVSGADDENETSDSQILRVCPFTLWQNPETDDKIFVGNVEGSESNRLDPNVL
jgi:hypothetical protein